MVVYLNKKKFKGRFIAAISLRGCLMMGGNRAQIEVAVHIVPHSTIRSQGVMDAAAQLNAFFKGSSRPKPKE